MWFIVVEVKHEDFMLTAVKLVVWHLTSPASYAIPYWFTPS